jgi:hypothetical protein
VVEHLVKAGAELLLAARALLEAGEAGAPARRAAGAPARRPAGVQRIRVG